MKLIEDLGMLYPKPTSKSKTRYGMYECPKCLKSCKVMTCNVKNGNSTKCTSCRGKISTCKHGLSAHPLHYTWTSMKSRCYDPNHKKFSEYGGKGVTVCAEWKDNFKVFYTWALANGWEKGLHCDKDKKCRELNISPMLYSPKTCAWLPNSTNTACSKKISKGNSSGYRGVDKCGKAWRARLTHLKVVHQLGVYKTKIEAATAYDTYVVSNKLPHTINGVIQDTRK